MECSWKSSKINAPQEIYANAEMLKPKKKEIELEVMQRRNSSFLRSLLFVIIFRVHSLRQVHEIFF